MLDARALAVGSIRVYRRTLSPLAERIGVRCRFTPTCSRYAEIVIDRDGVLVGGVETVKRIVRCNPLTPMGTRDDP
jgi:uncharacterized protein